jgi:hypothetical protein
MLLASGRLTFARRDEADAAHDDARYPDRQKLYEVDGPGVLGPLFVSLPGRSVAPKDGDAFEIYELETYDAAVSRLAEARSLKPGASS